MNIHSVRPAYQAWVSLRLLYLRIPRARIFQLLLPLLFTLGCESSVISTVGVDAGDEDTLEVEDAGAVVAVCPWDSAAEEIPFASGRVQGVLRGESRNRSTKCTQQSGAGGPEKIFRFQVPERRRVTLEVQSDMNTVVAIRSACDDPLTEVACGSLPVSVLGVSVDAGGGGFFPQPIFPPPPTPSPDASLLFASTSNQLDGGLRRVLDPGLYYIIVDQEEPFGVGGKFSLKVTVEDAPTTGTCESPIPVSANTTLVNESLDLGTPAPRCSAEPLPVARFFRVKIPSGHVLTANTQAFRTRSGELAQAFMQLHGSCDDTQCLAADAPTSQQTRTLKYSNNSAVDMEAILSVGTDAIDQEGLSFMLTLETHRPNLNNTCASAVEVTSGAFLQNQAVGDGVEVGPAGCSGTNTGALFYKAVLLPEQSITAAVSATPGAKVFSSFSTFFVVGCGTPTCLGRAARGEPQSYRNSSDKPMEIVLGVSNQSFQSKDFPATFFDLRVQLSEVVAVVITEAAPNLQVGENGSTATFKLKLNSPPKSPVSMLVTSSDTNEVTVNPTSVTFTPETWNAPAVITVQGVDDLIADGSRKVTISTSAAVSLDARFAGKVPSEVVVLNQDNEPGVFTPVSSVLTSKTGLAARVPVRLNSKPLSAVTLQVTTTRPQDVTTSAAVLVFTPETWNINQTVNVAGVVGGMGAGEQSFEVVIDGSSSLDTTWVGVPALRLPGKHRAYSFSDREATTISVGKRCSIGFTEWDRRIAVDRFGRLHVAMVCEEAPLAQPDSGFVNPKQATFVVTSEDGGRTFGLPSPTQVEDASNIALATGADGTAYLAASTPGVPTLLRLQYGATSWEKVPALGFQIPGFASVVASGDSVVMAIVGSGQAQVARNGSRALGTFEVSPTLRAFGSFALLGDANGVDIWQVISDGTSLIKRSVDGGKSFEVRGDFVNTIGKTLSGIAVGGNVLWALGEGSSLLRFDSDVEKKFNVVSSKLAFLQSPALVADNQGGVTMLASGFDGALRAHYFDRKGTETRTSKTLDTKNGQVSAVLLEDNAIAFTYAKGNDQRFGVLVWH